MAPIERVITGIRQTFESTWRVINSDFYGIAEEYHAAQHVFQYNQGILDSQKTTHPDTSNTENLYEVDALFSLLQTVLDREEHQASLIHGEGLGFYDPTSDKWLETPTKAASI